MKYELTPRQVEVARFALYMFARNARLRADAAAQKSSEEPFSNVAAFLKDAADAEELIGHLAAAPTTAATPAGMMLVPVEPTPEMLRDAQEACGMLGPILAGRVWSAMLAAAPKVAAEDLAVQAPAEAHGLTDPAILKEAGDRYMSSTSAQAFVNGALYARAVLAANVQPKAAGADVLALAHRIAWRYKKSSDPHHSDTYTFNRDTLLQFAEAVRAANVQPKGTEPVGHFIEDFGGEKGRWQQCKEAAHYTVPLFREPAQAPAPGDAPAAHVSSLESGSPLMCGLSDWESKGLVALYTRSAPCAAVVDGKPFSYSSTQATNCASCGKHKHTPLRIDAMGGYVCLTCIDKKLGGLLGEFGYEDDQQRVDAEKYRHWRDNAEVICAVLRYESPVWIDAYLAQALAERDAAQPPVQGSSNG